MSAFMVEDEHINVMVWAAGQTRDRFARPFAFKLSDGRTLSADTAEHAAQMGRFLEEANVASMKARYGDDVVDWPAYRYARPRWETWSPLEVARAVDCFECQSCEVSDWAGSDARRFCDALRLHLLDLAVAGTPMERVWGIGAAGVPTASRERVTA